jgi:hypothetical protein
MGENEDCKNYDPEKASAYVPDITNQKYQELLKAFIVKQMEKGCDGMWIDGLAWNARLLYQITGDENHIGVKEAVKAINSIVDWFHFRYPDKYIGSWVAGEASFIHPKLDFVSLSSFKKEEILGLKINESLWNEKIDIAHSKFRDVPLITFIDTGWGKSPMYYFSQELSPEQQNEFLRIADELLKEKGVIFAYPLHGGFMGKDATIFAYGKHSYYDSLAPEFQTYETIKELALRKKSKKIIGRR